MKITKGSIRAWSRLGQRGTFFGIAMPEIATEKENLKLLTADLSLLSAMDKFIEKNPEKFLNVGIAEQNMVGIASGLALEGYCVFASTYASFIAVRSLEHVRQHLSNQKVNVKIVGSTAGVVAAKSGVSHWASEDLAFMRALPNLTVMCAADSLEALKMAQYAASVDAPMYIRLNGALNCPIVYEEDYDFVPGKMNLLSEGSDVALLATGMMVHEAQEAAKILEEKGVSCTVADVHTLKPLDQETLDKIFANHKLIATVEEHNIIGGLGGAVAEYKATCENTPRQVFIGFPDSFAKAGSQRYIWEQKGMTAPQIADRMLQELSK